MKNNKKVILICTLLITSIFIITSSSVVADENIIYVDDDASPEWYDETHVRTIQEGIDIASDGDTIFVYSGTYYGLIIINKTLRLTGEEKSSTIIDGQQLGEDTITVNAPSFWRRKIIDDY